MLFESSLLYSKNMEHMDVEPLEVKRFFRQRQTVFLSVVYFCLAWCRCLHIETVGAPPIVIPNHTILVVTEKSLNGWINIALLSM